MSNEASESWMSKGPKRGILITPTCPFCKEPPVVWDRMGDRCSKCGRDGLQKEDWRIVKEKIDGHWKRFWAERERKMIERILGTTSDR